MIRLCCNRERWRCLVNIMKMKMLLADAICRAQFWTSSQWLVTRFMARIIHSGYFCSSSSSAQLLRGAPNTARIMVRSFTPKRYRQLRVKDLPMPKVLMRRLERDSNPWLFGRKVTNIPMSHTPHYYKHLRISKEVTFWRIRAHLPFRRLWLIIHKHNLYSMVPIFKFRKCFLLSTLLCSLRFSYLFQLAQLTGIILEIVVLHS